MLVQVTDPSGGGSTFAPCVELIAAADQQVVPGGEQICHSTTARITLDLPAAGTYLVLVSEAGNFWTGNYNLQWQRLRVEDAVPLSVEEIVSDALTPAGDLDLYAFTVAAAERVLVQVTDPSGGGSTFAPCVELIAAADQQVVPGGERICHSTTARITLDLPAAGTYLVLVSEAGNFWTGNYNLLLQVEPVVVSNLASGGTVTASSSFSANFGPEPVIDADIFTSWFTANGDAAPFLEIVLPATSIVSSIRMFGNRESPDGFDFLSGQFELFNAADEVVFDSGIVALPEPDRDIEIPVPDVSGVVRVRFTAETFESVDPGFAELQLLGSPD